MGIDVGTVILFEEEGYHDIIALVIHKGKTELGLDIDGSYGTISIDKVKSIVGRTADTVALANAKNN